MMRKVIENEFYDLNSERVSNEYFMEHIPDEYVAICNLLHHVDTRLRECERIKYYTPEGLLWRVQGYLTKEDLWLLMSYKAPFDNPDYNMSMVRFDKDTMEIWTMTIPFIKR